MSKRKQTKLLHVHSEGEEQQDIHNGQLTADDNLDTEEPPPAKTDTPTTTTTPTAATTSDTPTVDTPTPSSTDTTPTDTTPPTTRDLRGRKRKMSDIEDAVYNDSKRPSVTPTAFRDSSFQVNTSDIGLSPKKRNAVLPPPSFEDTEELTDYSRSRSSIATALVLAAESSRRQSSRLQLAASPSRAAAGGGEGGGGGGGKRTSHRTCEYCGVIKPTPAALQRHIRKHTGERPFVCQVCQKAYKAKRSLLCHQLTHHPELNDAANGINGSDMETIATPPKRGRKPSILRQIAPQPAVLTVSPSVSDVAFRSCVKAEVEDSPLDSMEGKNGTVVQNGCQSLAPKESTQDFSANVSTISADGMDLDGDETLLDASKRSCQFCHKEFIKPSDLRRHLMVHTGEKPHICQFCNKGFKQPQSLNYHLKATHKVNIPLSQGLEERYLRLKTRAAMRDLAAMDSWTPKSGGQDAIYTSELSSSSSFADSRPQSRETEKENHHQLLSAIPQPQASCSSSFSSPDFKHSLARQTSVASEGSWTEDRALGPNVIEVELPQFPALDGSLSEEPARKVPMMVKKETMLMTQLDGVCPITKQDMQVFRCCLCDKVCASMFHAFCHLSSHFEQNQVGLECRACNLAFTSQPEMDDHYQRQHNVCLNDLDLQNNNHKLKALKGEDRSKRSFNNLFSEKGSQALDDHNNNNDDHINKEDVAVCSDPGSPEPSSPRAEEGSTGFFDGLAASETFKYAGGKGAHRCPKCSKCYMTKFLLDRHMAFHTRQDLIESAMKSGASINGIHKDLLMQPPPVVPQDAHRYLQLQELDFILKAQQEENEREESEDLCSGESSTKQHVMNVGGGLDEGLEQERVEEVVVVMPTDPVEDDEDMVLEPDIDSEVKDSEVTESEIGVAPKRQLIPQKSESSPSKHQKTGYSPSKSRRKSSLPTRHRSALRALDSSSESQVSPPASTYPSEEPQQPEPSASSQETENSSHDQEEDPSKTQKEDPPSAPSCSNSPKRDTPEDSVSEPPSGNEVFSTESPKEKPAQQQQQDTSFLQNLHSAFSRMPPGLLANLYSNNGMFPPSSLATAAAGLYVVNQPVDRERLCKPTVLPDGRTVFRCIFCHKDFLSYSDINRHMDFHEDIRPYKCNFCDYYARTNSQLKVHMMRHQGIREYCCQLCKYKGVTQSDLNRHMKSQIHLLKSQNECSKCGEGFVTAKTLEKHLATNCKGSRKKKDK